MYITCTSKHIFILTLIRTFVRYITNVHYYVVLMYILMYITRYIGNAHYIVHQMYIEMYSPMYAHSNVHCNVQPIIYISTYIKCTF